jgi:conjugal transfer pilus assembly protein TraB
MNLPAFRAALARRAADAAAAPVRDARRDPARRRRPAVAGLRLRRGAPSGQAGKQRRRTPGPVTNIGVMPPGQQVNPVDQWVGTAGSKLAQYESEREEQGRLNKDRQAFEARTMQRFAELEQRLTAATQAVQAQPPAPTAQAPVGHAGQSALPPPPPCPAPRAGRYRRDAAGPAARCIGNGRPPLPPLAAPTVPALPASR